MLVRRVKVLMVAAICSEMSGSGRLLGSRVTKDLRVIPIGVIPRFISIASIGFCGEVVGRLVLGHCGRASATGIILEFVRFWQGFAVRKHRFGDLFQFSIPILCLVFSFLQKFGWQELKWEMTIRKEWVVHIDPIHWK